MLSGEVWEAHVSSSRQADIFVENYQNKRLDHARGHESAKLQDTGRTLRLSACGQRTVCELALAMASALGGTHTRSCSSSAGFLILL